MKKDLLVELDPVWESLGVQGIWCAGLAAGSPPGIRAASLPPSGGVW